MRNTATSRFSLRRLVVLAVVTIGLSGVAATAEASEGSVWDRLAQCESGQRWNINTGNGYFGGLQFSSGTWRAYGGRAYASYAHQASRDEQIAVAKKVLADQGWDAWPECSRKSGARSSKG